jgi:hypothetical protein
MGFFSFKTQDTNRSISNRQSRRGTFTVFMHDDKGNVYKESNYAGFGEFGGVDYYELLAEINGLQTREEGINLAYSGKPYKAPNLTESAAWNYINEAAERCENQGYFYESGVTFDLIEDRDGEHYIVTDNKKVYYLNELEILDLDVINNKVTVAI